MEKELYFIIEEKQLFLEKVLVDFENVPTFFLCSDGKEYYLALCTGFEESSYVVVKISLQDLYDLLHGIVPMGNIILRHKSYWSVITNEDIEKHVVQKKAMSDIDKGCLPKEGTYFRVLTDNMVSFVEKFDREVFQS